MYAVIFSRSSKKDIKKLSEKVSAYINNNLLKNLAANPYLGEKLHGELKNYWKLKFKVDNVNYRIIYEIYKNKLHIFVVMIGTRENIYKELRKRIK